MPACFDPRSIRLKEVIEKDGRVLTHVNVPCGKCENCVKRRRMEWCFRLEYELKRCKTAWFVTFTYEKVKYDKYGNASLWPKHLTKFFKRLRLYEKRKEYSYESLYNNLNDNDKIKYYACGEYGEDFGRPHYHAIIFNASQKCIKDAWMNYNVEQTKKGEKITGKDKNWLPGYVFIKKATPESIAYVTKYMDKWRNKKQDWKKQREFNVSSMNVGSGFVTKMTDYYRKNLDINYVISDKGIKIPMPRYYRLKMLNEEELQMQRMIINDAIEAEKSEQVLKLGIEEYNKRRLDKINYIKKQFGRGDRKRLE